MGNYNNINKNKYNDFYTSFDNKQIEDIRSNFKIIEVPYLNHIIVRSAIFADNYFTQNPLKTDIINNMLDYYLKHPDKHIYQKTDFLCNQKERVCICNIHAKDFRRIYDNNNFKEDDKYISWFKLNAEKPMSAHHLSFFKDFFNIFFKYHLGPQAAHSSVSENGLFIRFF